MSAEKDAGRMSMIDALNVERDADGNPVRGDEPPCPACRGSMRFCECMDDPFAPVEQCHPEDHDWVFDGYFWHVCDTCGAVS